MKRCFVGIVVFLLAFAVGRLVVELNYLGLCDTQPETNDTLQTTEPILTTPQEDDFPSLVRDLPNFGEFESDEHTTKLVDLREYSENEYRESEIIAKNGEKWLGLFAGKDGSLFKEVTVGVHLHHRSTDADYEDWYFFKSGWKKPPIFIVKDLTALRPRSVATLFHKNYAESVDGTEANPNGLRIGFNREFSLFDKEYVLRVVPGKTLDGTAVNVLVLESSGLSQVITYNLYYHDSTTLYDSVGELLFVGDLDGDLKLDFYLRDFDYEKGGFSSQLFLSSEAEPGKLVKLIAAFGTSGC
ncbi:MAG: hypothetical protein ACKVRN_16655 [Pyrinomonadaceae bacterium]